MPRGLDKEVLLSFLSGSRLHVDCFVHWHLVTEMDKNNFIGHFQSRFIK